MSGTATPAGGSGANGMLKCNLQAQYQELLAAKNFEMEAMRVKMERMQVGWWWICS